MISNSRLALAGLFLTGLMVGCSSNITLETPTFPTPLIEKIPVSVGLRIPDNFYDFLHEEEVLGREHWSINLGESNAALFTQLFEFMFDDMTIITADDDPNLASIDALIEPSIDAFEFSVPSQSKTESFAVWIRYRLRVYDRDGTQVSNWPVSAYGKSQTGSMSNSEALQRAAVLAMRDAAALMIMKMDEATGIGSMAGQPAAAPATGTNPPPVNDDGTQAPATEGPSDETS